MGTPRRPRPADESPEAAEPPDAPVQTVSDDIPLGAGYPTDEPDAPVRLVAGPGPAVEVCGQEILTGRDAADAASARYQAPEDGRHRTLIVFDDEQAAQEALAWTRSTVQGCVGAEPGLGVQVLGATEGADSFLWAENYGLPDQVMATTLVRLVRVGNALLVDSSGGELAGPADEPDAPRVVRSREQIEPILEGMAIYRSP